MANTIATCHRQRTAVDYCPHLLVVPGRIQTLGTRYPSFAAASIVAPRSLIGQHLILPECRLSSMPLKDQSDPNITGSNDPRSLAKQLGTDSADNIETWPGKTRADENTTIVDLGVLGDSEIDSRCASETTAAFNSFLELFQAASTIAFVVVLQTLVSAKTAAKNTKVRYNQRKEVRPGSVAIMTFFSALRIISWCATVNIGFLICCIPRCWRWVWLT